MDAGITPDGYLVEEMVTAAEAELILGIKSSRIYGHALILGRGGVDVETGDKAVALLLPAARGAIDRALAGLGVTAGLDPAIRGRIADIAWTIADYALANRATLAALDLNPVIVTQDGRVIAVDALIETGA